MKSGTARIRRARRARLHTGSGAEPHRGPGAKPLVGIRGQPPETENFLSRRHPKMGQICQILDILNKKLSSD